MWRALIDMGKANIMKSEFMWSELLFVQLIIAVVLIIILTVWMFIDAIPGIRKKSGTSRNETNYI